jgi:hypothetical protein
MEISSNGAGSTGAGASGDRVVEQAARRSKAAGHATLDNEKRIGIGCKYRRAQAWQTQEYRA